MQHLHNHEITQIHLGVVSSNFLVQTTNARSGLSLESKEEETTVQILPPLPCHQSTGNDENWHYH